jgi:hypothetical protein
VGYAIANHQRYRLKPVIYPLCQRVKDYFDYFVNLLMNEVRKNATSDKTMERACAVSADTWENELRNF